MVCLSSRRHRRHRRDRGREGEEGVGRGRPGQIPGASGGVRRSFTTAAAATAAVEETKEEQEKREWAEADRVKYPEPAEEFLASSP